MKKLAIILVGDPETGKSTTLIKYVKPEFDVKEKAHIFSYNGYNGYIKTQSLQEADQTLQESEKLEKLEKFQKYDVFVLTSHRKPKRPPTLKKISNKLKTLGFKLRKEFLESKWDENEEKETGEKFVKIIRGHLTLPRSSSLSA